jgi:SMI1 / KNR4 family (SUKH-1)
MKDIIDQISGTWYRLPGASAEEIHAVEERLNVEFPQDYKEFMIWSDSGEGRLGATYIKLWACEELEEANDDYKIHKYLPGLVGIGTDGGDDCYAFDYRRGEGGPLLVQVPLGALCPEYVVTLGRSFSEWLIKCLPSESNKLT